MSVPSDRHCRSMLAMLEYLADRVLVLPIPPQDRSELYGLFRRLAAGLANPTREMQHGLAKIMQSTEPAQTRGLVREWVSAAAPAERGGPSGLDSAADLITTALAVERSTLAAPGARQVRAHAPLTQVAATVRRRDMLRNVDRVVSLLPPGADTGAGQAETIPNNAFLEPDPPGDDKATEPMRVRVVIAGIPFAGNNPLVGALSEHVPVAAAVPLTCEVADRCQGCEVGLEEELAVFEAGQLTLDPQLVLELFTLPAETAAWDMVAYGALGAVVMVTPQRPERAAAAVNYFREADFPFAVAVEEGSTRRFWGSRFGRRSIKAVRTRLGLGAEVPFLRTGPHIADSYRQIMIALVTRAIQLREAMNTTTAQRLLAALAA